MNKVLTDLLKRAEAWPAHAQDELVEIANEIERTLSAGSYVASQEELDAIDDADRSGIATDEEVEAAFALFRRG
ncbi:MAG: hypothetical protein IT534_08405 [Bauldia sp.]|nr:hypothetical protein [Bauldia sp.]